MRGDRVVDDVVGYFDFVDVDGSVLEPLNRQVLSQRRGLLEQWRFEVRQGVFVAHDVFHLQVIGVHNN